MDDSSVLIHLLIALALATVMPIPISSVENIEIDPELDGFDLVYPEGFSVQPEEIVVWNNKSVYLAGTLTVKGQLFLENTTVTYGHNSTLNSSIVIQGSMVIRDLDGDPGTEYDSSHLIASNDTFVNITPSEIIGTIQINSSTVTGFNISGINTQVLNSTLANCSVRDIGLNSHFRSSHFFGPGSGVGLKVEKDMALDLEGCLFSGYEDSVEIGSGSIRILDSVISNTTNGVLLSEGAQLFIKNCTVSSVKSCMISNGESYIKESEFLNGSLFFNGSKAWIYDTKFGGTKTLNGVDNGIISGSEFVDCQTALEGISHTKVIGNRFTDCYHGLIETDLCEVYHNIFSSIVYPVSGALTSTYYNESLKEGNFWSSYNGEDNGEGNRRENDGIGDTNLPYLGRDLYPLMMEDYLDRPKIPRLLVNYKPGTDTVTLNLLDHGDGQNIIQRSTSYDFSTDMVTWSVDNDMKVIENNPNRTLYFRGGVYNGFGSRGWSDISSVIIDDSPLPPVDLSVSPLPEGESVVLNWNYSGEDIRSVVIHTREVLSVSELPIKVVSHPNNRTVITGLENGKVYLFSLFTVDGAGNPSDEEVNITAVPVDSVPPDPPRSLDGAAFSNQSVILHWSSPATQDIKSYLVYRKGPGDTNFIPLIELPEGALNYTDSGLKDNTTYQYGVSAVDDDGPISEMAGPLVLRTFHNNNPPNQTSARSIIEMDEDGEPAILNLADLFMDVDGDELTFRIDNDFRFQSELIGDQLRVVPEEDQEGDGYINLIVSDGEESISFFIPVIINPIPDPPRDVMINSPINGSTLKPGNSHVLSGYAYDPDENDRLTISWRSNKDGVLVEPRNIGGRREAFNDYVVLSPGVHEITLAVWDSTGNEGYANTTVAVSLWGFSDIPWNISLVYDKTSVTKERGTITILIINDGPLLLSFKCNGSIRSNKDSTVNQSIGNYLIVLPPGSQGTVVFDTNRLPFEGGDIYANFEIHARTLNNTYAGSLSRGFSVELGEEEDGESSGGLTAILLVIGILFILLMISVIVILFFRGTRGNIRGENKN